MRKQDAVEERVYSRAAELIAVARGVHEAFGNDLRKFMDPRHLSDAVRLVQQAAREIKGSYVVIIGGLAVQELGYERFTKDVDVIVDSDHFGALLDRLRELDFELTPLPLLKHRQTGVEIDLLREGTTLKDSKYPLPHPCELGPNRGFATLAGVVRLKLDARRRRDLADVVELMKRNLDKVEIVHAAVPEAFQKEFLELVEEARREAR